MITAFVVHKYLALRTELQTSMILSVLHQWLHTREPPSQSTHAHAVDLSPGDGWLHSLKTSEVNSTMSV